MSPESCKVVTASAENLSARIEEMYGSIGKGGSFRKLIPYMPEKARKSASDAEDAWSVAEAALNKYKLALDQFTNAIKDCD